MLRRPFFLLKLPESVLPLLLKLGAKVETKFPLFEVTSPVVPTPMKGPTGYVFYLNFKYKRVEE